MKSTVVSGNSAALASQYNDLRQDAYGGSQLLAHQQVSPDLTLKVEAGTFYVGGKAYYYAGGNSPSFTAPSTNPRIDLLVINTSGTLSRVAGTEAGSPVAPLMDLDKVQICQVYNRVGQSQIKNTDDSTNGYIYLDSRIFLKEGNSFVQQTTFSETNSSGSVYSVVHTETAPANKNCKFVRVQCRLQVTDNSSAYNPNPLLEYFDFNMNSTNISNNYDLATFGFYMKDTSGNWQQFGAELKFVLSTLTLTVYGPTVSTGAHSYQITGVINYYD